MNARRMFLHHSFTMARWCICYLLLSLLIAVSAISQLYADPLPDAVIGSIKHYLKSGTPVPAGLLGAVGSITRSDSEIEPVCTATLVGPDTVLTAAHCLCEGPNLNKYCVPTTDFILHDVRRWNEFTTNIDESAVLEEVRISGAVTVHPEYSVSRDDRGAWKAVNDLAIVRLKLPVHRLVQNVTPIPITPSTLLPLEGQEMTRLGRGKTGVNCAQPPQGLFQAKVGINWIRESSILIQDPEHQACSGDSGGPVLDPHGYVVAVHSSGQGSTGGHWSTASLTPIQTDWFRQFRPYFGSPPKGAIKQIISPPSGARLSSDTIVLVGETGEGDLEHRWEVLSDFDPKYSTTPHPVLPHTEGTPAFKIFSGSGSWAVVENLPVQATLWVRYGTKTAAGWTYSKQVTYHLDRSSVVFFKYPQLRAPVPGSVIFTSDTQFRGKDEGLRTDMHRLWIGTARGGKDIFDGPMQQVGTDVSVDVKDLPWGGKIFARHRFRYKGGRWQHRDYEYKMAVVKPRIISPLERLRVRTLAGQSISISSLMLETPPGLIHRGLFVGTSQGKSDITGQVVPINAAHVELLNLPINSWIWIRYHSAFVTGGTVTDHTIKTVP